MQWLYLIRHTRPDIAPGICYGQLDIGLADSFAGEAQDILHYLPRVDLILTSPLQRTRMLAEQLSQAQHCALRADEHLMEKHFGIWEGRPWDDLPRNEIDAWANDVLGYAPRDGESALQLIQRTQQLLHDIARLPHRHIALVAHGGSIRALLALTAGIPLADTLDWQIDYGAVIALRLP